MKGNYSFLVYKADCKKYTLIFFFALSLKAFCQRKYVNYLWKHFILLEYYFIAQIHYIYIMHIIVS